MLGLEIGDVRVEYSDEGTGDPLVLIHGGLFSDWFIPVAGSDALSRFRVIRMRRAGYVRPEDAGVQMSMEDRAAHCALLLQELGVEKAHICGHSSGAIVALQLALDSPDLVQSLILFEPAPMGALAGDAAMALVAGPFQEMANRFVAGDSAGAFDLFMRTTCSDHYAAVIETALGPGALDRAIFECPAFLDEARASLEWAFGQEQADRVVAPLLVVAGAETAAASQLPPDSVELLASLVPHATTATLAGANHLMPLEDPTGVSRLIAEFISRHAIQLSVA